jgi:Fe(3+) dicitrate transport protein
MRRFLLIVCVLYSVFVSAQSTVNFLFDRDVKGELNLFIITNTGSDKYSINDKKNKFSLPNNVSYKISVNSIQFYSDTLIFYLTKDTSISIKLYEHNLNLAPVEIKAESDFSNGRITLKGIEGVTVYEGKKNEIVDVKSLTVNTATNNARQVFSKVTGLNIWENDGGGLQLAIGGRGLNPNRISNFNTRQNGYDISADALGYPESYYTPPIEALDRIEILRGAASLQYGPQFGGLINFKFKQPSPSKIQLINRTTYGSFNFLNSFNSLSGRINRFSYYTYFQFKKGDGWRDRSAFDYKNAFLNINYQLTEKIKLSIDYTYMNYLAQQPGGLTDAQFENNAALVLRRRNWFKVNWNLAAFKLEYLINDRLKLHSQTFYLYAGREALGILTQINRADPNQERDLWKDHYQNVGNETRLLYTYFINELPQNLLVGLRVYNGSTHRMQGLGNKDSTGNIRDFKFNELNTLGYSDYNFPSFNSSLFMENIISITPNFKLVPGIRYEYIQTNARGYYQNIQKDFAGNIIFSEIINENISRTRSVIVGGMGFSYRLNQSHEMFANITQNYRSINFNDMRVVNPNLVVDPNLKDERGYSSDIGVRGNFNGVLNYDLNIFYMRYANRIGTILKVDSNSYNLYRFRTNVSESYSLGVESFMEVSINKILNKSNNSYNLSLFNNTTLMDARYINSSNLAIQNKQVEYAPPLILKNGVNYKWKNLSFSLQHSYTSLHFSDATNAVLTSNAINGAIPSFSVFDFSFRYTWRFMTLESSINNLFDKKYFTRRAEGYPGPGIIPADIRSYFLTLEIKI